jgi:flagellar motor component MotA
MKNIIGKVKQAISKTHNQLAKLKLVTPSRETQKRENSELMAMLFDFYQLFRKEGPQAIARHIDDPAQSSILKCYPSVLMDFDLVESFCDILKITLSADISPEQLKDWLLEKEFDEPLTTKMKVMNASLVAMQSGCPPLVCIEVGRKQIPLKYRPTFEEMQKATFELKKRA